MENSVIYKNSEKFLTSFNRIEKLLKSLLFKRKEAGFSKAVKILRNSNAIVKRYSDDLLEFAELRNAIVHNKVDMAYLTTPTPKGVGFSCTCRSLSKFSTGRYNYLEKRLSFFLFH